MGDRELNLGGAEVFERKKVKEGNEKNGWITTCGREGRRECLTMVEFEPLLLVFRHSKTLTK
jgi:hypothetical protein